MTKVGKPEPTFDIFLSHTRHDQLAARRLAEALRDADLSVWFDEWELVPGASWEQELEGAIESSRAVAAIIGSQGLGPWQKEEIAAAFNQAKGNSPPVIPVLLPGARRNELPSFLDRVTYISFKSWTDDQFEKAVDRIIWSVTGRQSQLHRPERSTLPRVFLCRAKEDTERVERLYFFLRDRGLDPLWDQEKLAVGDRWKDEISQAIEKMDFFALCLSPRSVKKVGFIQREIRMAVRQYQRRPQGLAYLLPVRLEACEVPDLRLDELTTLRDLQWEDLFVEEERALDRFANGIHRQFRKHRETS